jgi:hypothetical protein
MKASAISFEKMRVLAACNRQLAVATSFMQVEYGLLELQAAWDGFVDVSDNYNQTFVNRKGVLKEFTYALEEYLEFLHPTFREMGQALYSDC